VREVRETREECAERVELAQQHAAAAEKRLSICEGRLRECEQELLHGRGREKARARRWHMLC
jgi:hypothetical protein